MQKLTDVQRWKSIDCHMSDPLPLRDLDTSRPFVYDRHYGAFYVPSGLHQGAMSLLLAWHHGLDCGTEVADKLGLEYSEETADAWLRDIPGTAFRSSVGNGKIQAGKRGNLTGTELKHFFYDDIEYLF